MKLNHIFLAVILTAISSPLSSQEKSSFGENPSISDIFEKMKETVNDPTYVKKLSFKDRLLLGYFVWSMIDPMLASDMYSNTSRAQRSNMKKMMMDNFCRNFQNLPVKKYFLEKLGWLPLIGVILSFVRFCWKISWTSGFVTLISLIVYLCQGALLYYRLQNRLYSVYKKFKQDMQKQNHNQRRFF